LNGREHLPSILSYLMQKLLAFLLPRGETIVTGAGSITL
jgi:hypothetical protein